MTIAAARSAFLAKRQIAAKYAKTISVKPVVKTNDNAAARFDDAI